MTVCTLNFIYLIAGSSVREKSVHRAPCSQSFRVWLGRLAHRRPRFRRPYTPVPPEGPGDAHSRHLIGAAGCEVPWGSRIHCLQAPQLCLCHGTALGLDLLLCETGDFPEMKAPLLFPCISCPGQAAATELGEAPESGCGVGPAVKGLALGSGPKRSSRRFLLPALVALPGAQKVLDGILSIGHVMLLLGHPADRRWRDGGVRQATPESPRQEGAAAAALGGPGP